MILRLLGKTGIFGLIPIREGKDTDKNAETFAGQALFIQNPEWAYPQHLLLKPAAEAFNVVAVRILYARSQSTVPYPFIQSLQIHRSRHVCRM